MWEEQWLLCSVRGGEVVSYASVLVGGRSVVYVSNEVLNVGGMAAGGEGGVGTREM